MSALEVINGNIVGIPAAIAAIVPAPGDSFTVRNCSLDKKVKMLSLWVQSQVVGSGIVRVRSPRLHDNVENFRAQHVPATLYPLTPPEISMPLIPQDDLIVEMTGGLIVTTIDNVCLLNYYEDLQGINARFITDEEVKTRTKNVLTVECPIIPGILGGWSGAVPINATFDLFKQNMDYAILGYHVNFECAAVGFLGSDFGNVRLGGPGCNVDKKLTAGWFMDLSRNHKLPLVPVFNSANIDALFVSICQNDLGVPVIVSVILAELSQS